MSIIRSMRTPRRRVQPARARRPAQPLALLAIVDGDRIPPRSLGDALCIASVSRRFAKAYAALVETLGRNRQIGLTAVAVDGEPCVAALVPVGGVLAVTPFRREYASAWADGLSGRGRTPQVARGGRAAA